MKNLIIAISVFTILGCSNKNTSQENKTKEINSTVVQGEYKAELLLNLPTASNTPDGAAMDIYGNIILSIPNFNNEYLIKKGELAKPSPAVLAKLDKNNRISTWYEFLPEDMHPETGKIGPMDAAFGPDGNLYVADMQIFWNGENKSRLLRINVEDGRAIDMDVVVEGFIVANGVCWKENTLFVSETILKHPVKTEKNQPKQKLTSGVYAFTLDELSKSKIILTPYSKKNSDSHLIVQFESSNRIGFGADGITIDAAGNLFTTIVEDGIVHKTKLDNQNKAIETELFAQSENMTSSDGIVWNPADNKFYVADFLGNAVHSINMQGEVTTLHKNGDTDGADGSLDQPCEVIIRGTELIVVNMDMAWAVPNELCVDTEVDQPYTLSVIQLDSKTKEAMNKQLVLDFWKYFSLGDKNSLSNIMTVDATFTVIGRENGFEGIGEMSVPDLLETIDWITDVMPKGLVYSIKSMIAENDRVSAEDESYGVTTNGEEYRGLYSFVFEIENGKIKTVREYLETIHAQQILIEGMK